MNTHSQKLATAPIGVFDSGVGGLTVLRALSTRLPHERFLYLGDLARVPYGSKSPETVRRYALECAQYLVQSGVKAVVVACNTATALALDEIRAAFPIPVFGVVEAGVEAALGTLPEGERQFLVLGTAATIRSGAYRLAFQRLDPRAQVEEIPCPLLVPLAEEGWFDDAVTEHVIRSYLVRAKSSYRGVVLGCTHYPLLQPSFRRAMGRDVALIHGAERLAVDVEQVLRVAELLAPSGPVNESRLSFFSTDQTTDPLFAQTLFGHPTRFVTVSIDGSAESLHLPPTDKRAAPLDPMYL